MKCSQSQCTGTVGENLIRYTVARDPCDTLYVGGQQETTEKLIESRIKKGLQVCSAETAARWATARERGMDVFFPDMILSGIWGSSINGIKSFSYRRIIADEASIYDAEVIAKLKKRFITEDFPKLIVMSAMDKMGDRPSSHDPTLLEFKKSDQSEWMMPDPGAPANLFRYEMGFRDKAAQLDLVHGLKWSKDARTSTGEWNMRRVIETAHYVTPSGHVITDADKSAVMRTGRWVPQKLDAIPCHRGARVTWFMLPWISFSKLAKDFLEAKENKASLRVFVLESLAEEFWDDREAVESDVLAGRIAEYPAGAKFTASEAPVPGQASGITLKSFYIGKGTETFLSVDVQKDHFWALAREWVRGGDSGLVHYQRVDSNEWSELDGLADSLKCGNVWIDNTYAERKQEVFEHCATYKGFVPCIFRDSRMVQSWMRQTINPFEGTSRAREGVSLGLISFDRTTFVSHLLDLMAGRTRARWFVHNGIPMEYRRQVTAWEIVDGKVANKPGHHADHLAACEVLQLVAATVQGYTAQSAPVESRPG